MLSVETIIEVKFTDADPLGIVWHGNYIKYFEEGREDFGKKYNCRYLDYYKHGFLVPIVDVQCKFKKPLQYGESAKLITTYKSCPAAKLIFEYTLTNLKNDEISAIGSSTQVFLFKETRKMSLINPDFFELWKDKYLPK